MNPFDVVKNTLAMNLEKQGHSLNELETALSELNTGEGVLGVYKMAAGMMPNPIGEAASFAANSYFPLTMGAGALAGLGVDAAEGKVRDQNKKLDEMRHNIEILKKLKHNIAIEHGIA